MTYASLTQRLALWFVVVALLPLLLFGYLSLRQNEAVLHAETEARMSRLADKKAKEIRIYLAERVHDVEMLGRNIVAEQAMSGLLDAYSKHGPGSDEYQKADMDFRSRMSVYITGSAFYDLFLITPQGEIIYTDRHESDFATNLLDGPYRNSPLAQAFRESSLTLESSFSGFDIYAPSRAPAAFVAAPVLHEGVFRGVIAFQLSNESIYRVTMDASGLGVTGETVLAKLTGVGEALFVAPLRHDPQAAMRHKIDLFTTATPMRHALAGQHGGGIAVDYSGTQVVAAWRYLPELRWGMVVKMDAEEMFAPVRRQRRSLLGALLALVLLAGAAAFYFGRQMVIPLKALTLTANQISQGDLGKRVVETGADEVGTLGRAFNRMTENLQALYRTLEDRVEERTRELNVSNEQLHEEIYEREHIEKALRENEELLSSVMRLLPVGVWIMNAEGKIIFENNAGQKIWAGAHGLGAERSEKRKGWHLGSKKLIEPDEWAQVRAINKGETTIEEEIEIECSDGAHKIIFNSALPLRDSNGSISGAIAVNQDITARKQIEAQLVDSISSLEVINKALDEFTYIAAHDLKEPLRGIHNYTSFLKEDYGPQMDDNARQYIGSIQRLAERLSDLIDRLLAYSRLGSTELAKGEVNVDEIVFAVVEDLNRLWRDTSHGGLGIELRASGPLGTVQGDATRIGEVFQNLISNASKYNDKPSKWIEIGCDRTSATPVFYVRDNGIGIQPHHQESVFRIFKRLHEQNKYGGGTGAGLTITKKIIELHGGRIWLESTPGEGTTFYFTLSEEA